jgi:hypothetical protein
VLITIIRHIIQSMQHSTWKKKTTTIYSIVVHTFVCIDFMKMHTVVTYLWHSSPLAPCHYDEIILMYFFIPCLYYFDLHVRCEWGWYACTSVSILLAFNPLMVGVVWCYGFGLVDSNVNQQITWIKIWDLRGIHQIPDGFPIQESTRHIPDRFPTDFLSRYVVNMIKLINALSSM